MGKIIITNDSRKKCDIVIGKGGVITIHGQKNLVVRIDDNDDNPCKATRVIVGKMMAGGAEHDSDGD